nr:MAG TPA: hypothetical protein [Caudoviricetes sp.]
MDCHGSVLKQKILTDILNKLCYNKNRQKLNLRLNYFKKASKR